MRVDNAAAIMGTPSLPPMYEPIVAPKIAPPKIAPRRELRGSFCVATASYTTAPEYASRAQAGPPCAARIQHCRRHNATCSFASRSAACLQRQLAAVFHIPAADANRDVATLARRRLARADRYTSRAAPLRPA